VSAAASRPQARKAGALTRGAVLGTALLGAALTLLAVSRTWVAADVPDLPAADVGVTGRQAAPVVAAVALAAAAAAVVLATAGRAVRLVAAVALAAAGAGVVAGTLAVVADPDGAVRPAVTEASGVTGTEVAAELRLWPWPAAAGGVLLAAAGLAGLAGARTWPAPARRYERAAGTPGAGHDPADDAATWDALSRGEDPTAAQPRRDGTAREKTPPT
jgi:uncharacterized membrane protein (TIGR02234 family)